MRGGAFDFKIEAKEEVACRKLQELWDIDSGVQGKRRRRMRFATNA